MRNSNLTHASDSIIDAFAEDILALSDDELLIEIEAEYGNVENFIESFFQRNRQETIRKLLYTEMYF